jgi:hypothetical protein
LFQGELVIVNTEFDPAPPGAISRNAERAAELEALRRDFPGYGFEAHVLAGLEHYTARRRPGQPNVHPYSVTSADLDRIRRELAAGSEGHTGSGTVALGEGPAGSGGLAGSARSAR